MLYKVDFSKQAFRLMYDQIYSKVLIFALASGDSEELVKAKFAALIAGNPNVHLVIKLNDKAELKAYCLYTLQQPFIQVDYIEVDSGHDNEFVQDVLDLLDSYKEFDKIIMGCNENKYKAYNP